MKHHKLLIPLDCLFDTYLGVVDALYPKTIISLLSDGYFGRVHNKLSAFNKNIDDLAVAKRWSNRDIEILRNSKRSALVSVLMKYFTDVNNSNEENPLANIYTVVINTWPYDLANQELVELFSLLIDLFNIGDIKRVHVAMADLTPEYIKEKQYTKFFLYDWNEWHYHHKLALQKCKIPKITCVFPLTYINGVTTAEHEEEVIKWAAAGAYLHIDLEIVRLADMSIDAELLLNELKEIYDPQTN